MALFDLPANLFSSTFIFQVFIPFIILFAILWGLLESMGKFSFRVNFVVAMGFSLIAAFTNPWILAYIATLGSYAAVVLFGALFLFGVIRWGLGRGKEIHLETAPYESQIQNMAKKIDDLKRDFPKQNEEQQKHTIKTIEDLEMKMKKLKMRQETLT